MKRLITAITSGSVGYSINSFTRLGGEEIATSTVEIFICRLWRCPTAHKSTKEL